MAVGVVTMALEDVTAENGCQREDLNDAGQGGDTVGTREAHDRQVVRVPEPIEL